MKSDLTTALHVVLDTMEVDIPLVLPFALQIAPMVEFARRLMFVTVQQQDTMEVFVNTLLIFAQIRHRVIHLPIVQTYREVILALLVLPIMVVLEKLVARQLVFPLVPMVEPVYIQTNVNVLQALAELDAKSQVMHPRWSLASLFTLLLYFSSELTK